MCVYLSVLVLSSKLITGFRSFWYWGLYWELSAKFNLYPLHYIFWNGQYSIYEDSHHEIRPFELLQWNAYFTFGTRRRSSKMFRTKLNTCNENTTGIFVIIVLTHPVAKSLALLNAARIWFLGNHQWERISHADSCVDKASVVNDRCWQRLDHHWVVREVYAARSKHILSLLKYLQQGQAI